jgi:hypothetical protein
MPGAVVPFYFHTYDCSCGWQKIGDKRTVDLATKLHNKKNHSKQEVVQLPSADITRPTKSEAWYTPPLVRVSPMDTFGK